jgi:hypothetical protein
VAGATTVRNKLHLGRVRQAGVPATGVLRVRDRLKMSRVYAARSTAKVIELQVVRDDADECLIGDTMRTPWRAI